MFGKLRMIMNSGSVLGYFLQALPVALLAGAVYLVVRICHLKGKKERVRWEMELLRVLFVCYLTGLVSLVILPANFWLRFYDGLFFGWWDQVGPLFRLGDVNLVPSVVRYLRGELSLGSWVKTMLVGNVAMFVPLGFFLPLVTGIKTPCKAVIAAIAAPLCCEILQLLFGRSFDVDDLICNFVGIVIGAAIGSVVLKAANGKKA